MATHDYVISNASGAAVRADLNNALAAIVSNNSNATEPSTTYSYMLWADTGSSPPAMKLRNAANDGWVTLFQLDGEWSTLAVEDGTAAAPSIYFKDSGTDTGFFSSGTDEVAITTGGTQRATIDSSGRLLVGTSSARADFFGVGVLSPQAQIETANSSTRAASILSSASGVEGGLLVLAKQKSGSVGGNTVVASSDELGQVSFFGSDGTKFLAGASIQVFVDGTPGADDMPGRLVFSTTADGSAAPTERVRITQSGDTLFGCTAVPSASVAGAGFIRQSNGRSVLITSTSSTASNILMGFYNPNGFVGNITIDGSATSYNTSSDYRLKENVVPLTGAIDRIQQIPVHRFNFIADPDKTVDGFIAHEAQAVVPECVTGEKDAVDDDGNPIYQGIDQSKLVPLLTAALQEAITKIETLEAAVAALEAA